MALSVLGRGAAAIAQFRRVLERTPDHVPTRLSLAQILAAHPDSRLRDGAEAIRVILPACEKTGHKAPELLDTLAAAYAQAGQFPQALATATKALQLARQRSKTRLAARIRYRLQFYQRARPCPTR